MARAKRNSVHKRGPQQPEATKSAAQAAKGLTRPESIEDFAENENVTRTDWIDERLKERLMHDNNSEEIINKYGGGD